MLIETFSGHYLNPDKVVDYRFGLAEDGKDVILAEFTGKSRRNCVIARFDSADQVNAGMRRLARLLAEPGRALITQEDIHRSGTDVFSGGNWIGRALMACVRNNGGELHLSAEEMQWLPEDGSVQAEHKEDGGVSLAWDATEAGLARQQALQSAVEGWPRWQVLGALVRRCADHTGRVKISQAEIDRDDRIWITNYLKPDGELILHLYGFTGREVAPLADDAPPLKYRLGWKTDKGAAQYAPPEDDADFDTAKERWQKLLRTGGGVTGCWDVGIYLVESDGSLTRMEG